MWLMHALHLNISIEIIMKEIVVCTKPLQFINAKNMVSGLNKYKEVTLVVMNSFKDAWEFTQNVRLYDDSWKNVLFLNKRNELYTLLIKEEISTLYIDSDMSTLLSLIVKFKSLKVFTYEEGWASYSLVYYQSAFKKRQKSFFLHRLLDIWLGNSNITNDSKWLSGSFLYYPSLFKFLRPTSCLCVMEFRSGFVDFIQKEDALLNKLFKNAIPESIKTGGNRVLIYLTSWELNPIIIEEIDRVRKDFDMVLVKPHPHIKHNISIKDCIILNSSTIAEFVMIKLISLNKSITVFHENSTSMLYFQKYVKIKNFGRDDEEYDKILEYIKLNS